MPGVPSIYYGSEWGIRGEKHDGNDAPLRPAFTWPVPEHEIAEPWLAPHIARLAETCRSAPALRHGGYAQLHVTSEHLAFSRTADRDVAVVVVNAGEEAVSLDLSVAFTDGMVLTDQLDSAVSVTVRAGMLKLSLVPGSARILTGSTPG